MQRPLAFATLISSGLLAIHCLGCTGAPLADGRPPKAVDAPSASMADERGAAVTSTNSRGWWEPGAPTFLSSKLQQTIYLEDSRLVAIENIEVVDGAKHRVAYEFSTSFDVTALCNRGTTGLYFAGSSPSAGTVIERWEIQPHRGSIVARLESTGAVTGVAALAPTITTEVVGGTWVPVEERTSNPRVVRTELVRAPDVGPIRCMDVDPEGRFLLYVNDAGDELYTLDLQGGSGPQILHTADTMWTLPRIEYVNVFQHKTLGRVWYFTYSPHIDPAGHGEIVHGTALIDADNDGLFERLLIDEEKAMLQGVVAAKDLASNFLTYR